MVILMRVYSFGYMFVATTSKSQVPSTAASVILLFVLDSPTSPEFLHYDRQLLPSSFSCAAGAGV
jgi:hypothetical protein